MGRLDGKVALISGAARGIGAETARAMVREGASVVLGDVLTEAAQDLAHDLTRGGGAATAVQLDVAREEDWQAAVSEAVSRNGKLDILVNNAGIFLGIDFEEASLDDWQKLVAVNMTGVFLGTKIAAPALRRSGAASSHGSAIINLSSVAGLVGSVADPLYSMTKGGVALFTKSTALVFGRKGDRIRVNSVHPGVIETDMGEKALSRRAKASASNDLQEVAKQLHPIGRLGVPDDVASAIVFLASDEAKFITGSALVVDGGLTAQ